MIEDELKFSYYRRLSEYPKIESYLTDTCLSIQDNHKELMKYFEIEM